MGSGMLFLVHWNLDNFNISKRAGHRVFHAYSVEWLTISFCLGSPEPQLRDVVISVHVSLILSKKIASLGYDIIDGMKINEEERKLLSVIIGINLCDNMKNEDDEEDKRNEDNNEGEIDENNIKDDFEFGNKIVALIERDVNELYSRKLIHQVKIDQIDAITYSFSDDVKEKNVSFKIENNNLFCIDNGESFTVWLLRNFST